MARKKEFDTRKALDRAVDLFWRKGYEATSVQDLLDHLKISRQSLYDTFGDKHRLFLAALDRYSEVQIGEILGELETPEAGLMQIRKCFEVVLEALVSEAKPRACLMINSTMELARRYRSVAQRARAYARRFEAAFLRAIANAVERGELRPGRDPLSLARHLTSCLVGMNCLAKAGSPRKELRDVAEVGLSVLV